MNDRFILPPNGPLPNVPIIGADDGGLARRQLFRHIKDRMAAFKRRQRMICAMCNEAQKSNPDKVINVRSFRSWSALRSHLIDHHGIDRREVPE